MEADFSVELGHDDPVLDFPWADPQGKIAYVDLKRHPELLARVPEVDQFPELGAFLRTVNSAISMVESAKCDAWATEELTPEEEIFGGSHKFGSYVDLVFTRLEDRDSFPFHERFARRLVGLLRQTPETVSAAEVCVRRAYFADAGNVHEGCYFTFYVSGYGDAEDRARLNWEIGLKLVGNAVLQLSAASVIR